MFNPWKDFNQRLPMESASVVLVTIIMIIIAWGSLSFIHSTNIEQTPMCARHHLGTVESAVKKAESALPRAQAPNDPSHTSLTSIVVHGRCHESITQGLRAWPGIP